MKLTIINTAFLDYGRFSLGGLKDSVCCCSLILFWPANLVDIAATGPRTYDSLQNNSPLACLPTSKAIFPFFLAAATADKSSYSLVIRVCLCLFYYLYLHYKDELKQQDIINFMVWRTEDGGNDRYGAFVYTFSYKKKFSIFLYDSLFRKLGNNIYL